VLALPGTIDLPVRGKVKGAAPAPPGQPPMIEQ
jgi:hypothetical protein